jgi:hypothetical protein
VLVHDTTFLVEAKKRRAGERDELAVFDHHCPPFDDRAIA